MEQQGFWQTAQCGAIMMRMAPLSGRWRWENGYGWKSLFFPRLPGAPAAAQDVTAWYWSPGLRANFPVPFNIYGGGGVGGVGGHWKALLSKIVRDSSVVRLQSYGLDLKQVIRNGSWKQKKICGLWMHSYAMMRHQNVQRRWVTPLTGLLSAVTGWQWKVCIPPSACVPHNLLINFYNGGGRMQIIGVVNIWIKVLLFSQTRQHKNTLQPFHLHCTITHNEVSISYSSAAL